MYRTVEGNFIIANNSVSKQILSASGVVVAGVDKLPKETKVLKPLRIALWDTYGGSMPSGWTRFLFEKYGFNFELVFAPDLDKGNLNAKYDVIVLPSNAIIRPESNLPNNKPNNIPEPYASQWGSMTIEKTLPQLEQFIKNGGHIIAVGNSAKIAEDLKIGVTNHLVDAQGKPLKREIFYTPGSVLTAAIDINTVSGKGYPQQIDLYFSNNNVYKINDPHIKPILWFSSEKVLKSGWSWGEKYLKDGVIGFEKQIEKGKLTIFTPDITFRAQAHGTFKLLFNNLY